MNDTKRNIILIGAFERDNLGDILFSKIFKKLLNDYVVINSSLLSNDLTSIGGDRTLSISLLRNKNTSPIAVIYCGGETLLCNKKNALRMDMNPVFYKKNLPGLELSINNIIKAIFPAIDTFGYVFSRQELNIKKEVPIGGYFSVGGSNEDILKKNKSLAIKLKNKLDDAKCIFVRDNNSKKNLIKYAAITASVYPDLVTIISHFYKKEINKILRLDNFFKNNKQNSYLVFQVNKKYIEDNGVSAISNILIKIFRMIKKTIVLQPMGIANFHDSIEMFNKIVMDIKNKSPFTKIIVQKDRDIWKQVSVLSNSYINIGTSLHLRIISTSYANHVISLENNKVTNYLKTWGRDKQPFNVKLRDLEGAIYECFSIDQSTLNNTRDYFIKKTLSGLKILCKNLNLKINFKLQDFDINDSNICYYYDILSSELSKNRELLIEKIKELNIIKNSRNHNPAPINNREIETIKKELSLKNTENQNLEKSLNQIKSAKFFKLWQGYCKIRDKFF